VLFYSVVLGSIGPVLVLTVPPIRERLGYRPPEFIPTTYPRASLSPLLLPYLYFRETLTSLVGLLTVPKRPRRPVHGYEDE
jgi:hypothetical protein